MSHSKKRIQEVWDKAKKVRGKNPNLYRKDACGNVIYRHSYGKQSPMAWEMDHIVPKAKGGTNKTSNLQPLQWQANRTKSTRKRSYCRK